MSTTALMTFAEFERLPEKSGKQELLDGELIELPPAEGDHMIVAKRIYRILLHAFGDDDERLWFETGYRIGGGWLIPDISVSRPDQRPSPKYILGAPQVAIEIVSPGNSAEQVDRKISAYLSDGGQEVWVIYPKTRRMVVYSKTSEEKTQAQVIEGKYTSALLNAEIDLDAIIPAAQ